MQLPKALRNTSLVIGAFITLFIILCAVFAPYVATHGVEQMDMRNRFAGPTLENILGTDNFGRDLWSRLVFGARVSLTIAIIMVAWTKYARVVRATTLVCVSRITCRPRAIGASPARILFMEILPNALGPIIALSSLGLGTAIIAESALSFLGFGLPPPTPTWGWTLAYRTKFMRDAPWLYIISGAAIMVTVLGFNLLGCGLRDALDPRQLSRGGDEASKAK